MMGGNSGVKFPKGGDKIHLFLKDKGGAGNPSVANNPKAMTKRRDNQPRETGGADRAASLAVTVFMVVLAAAALTDNGWQRWWHWRQQTTAEAVAVQRRRTRARLGCSGVWWWRMVEEI
jgi:hypothetical protein